MPASLDRTGQRIVGVLLEKQLAVPDSYPMSEHALVDGCNQKNNRDPLMELESFQVHGALLALQEQGWVARVEGGGRVPKFRHRIEERFALDPQQRAVLAELLVRGPQAVGALKTRVARMGFHAVSTDAVEQMLRAMASRPEPLVELLPLGPRERDPRWRHLLGDAAAASDDATGDHDGAAGDDVPETAPVPLRRVAAPAAAPAPAPAGDLGLRVAALEREVAALRARLQVLEERAAP